MALKRGDLVRIHNGLMGTVWGYTQSRVYLIVELVPQGITYWRPTEVQRVCVNCHQVLSAHVSSGRCLFGASTWR